MNPEKKVSVLDMLKSPAILWAMIGLNTGTLVFGLYIKSTQISVLALLTIAACMLAVSMERDDDNVK